MRNVVIILFVLLFCLPAVADQRGVSFEKDGLVYVISSETIMPRWSAGENKRTLKNVGEVYVSGVTVSDSSVAIPPIVLYPSTFCRKDTTVLAEYNVRGIGAGAFRGARLKNLIIPFGLKFIGDEAFRDLEITSGVLAVPPATRMKRNVFEGMKSKVHLLYSRNVNINDDAPLMIYFENTFENKEDLPDFYVVHGDRNAVPVGMDRRLLYTIGKNVWVDWLRNSWGKDFYDRLLMFGVFRYEAVNAYYGFQTLGGNSAPQITCKYKSSNKYEKVGTDIDMLPMPEFVCMNFYTGKKDTYDEFVMNETLFRCKKGEKYSYFTLDGKPITDTESLLDASGRDPFGLQVRTKEEVKEKNAAKERENNLNKKVDDLKKAFGF